MEISWTSAMRVSVLAVAICSLTQVLALGKRATNETISIPASFHINGFYVNASIGTPPQDVSLAVNFASGDMYTSNNKCAGHDPEPNAENHVLGPEACLMPGFDVNLSTTVQTNMTNRVTVQAAYNDGSLVVDNVSLGSTELPHFGFGVMSELRAAYETGNLGLCNSYYCLHVLISDDVDYEYKNLMDRLIDDGTIDQAVASVYFGEGEGEVLLGGVDKAKYSGDLQWFDMDSGGKIYCEGYGMGSDSMKHEVSVIMGPFLNVSIIPDSMFDYIVEQTEGEVINAERVVVDCSYLKSSETFSVYTGNGNLTVPFSNFVKKLDDGKCYLTLVPSEWSEEFQAGYDFFQHLYVTVNYDEYVAGFAPLRITNEQEVDSSGQVGTPSSVASAMFATFVTGPEMHFGFYGSSTDLEMASATSGASSGITSGSESQSETTTISSSGSVSDSVGGISTDSGVTSTQTGVTGGGGGDTDTATSNDAKTTASTSNTQSNSDSSSSSGSGAILLSVFPGLVYILMLAL